MVDLDEETDEFDLQVKESTHAEDVDLLPEDLQKVSLYSMNYHRLIVYVRIGG